MMKTNAPAHDELVRLIETDAFPFDFLSALAERESWRKEVYRPIYHIHKWWAKRLGSIFRGILLGSLLSEKDDLRSAFYQNLSFDKTSVLDPFMGSGTTVGEAHKLGCIALGRDINPVACESVRVALGQIDEQQLHDAFAKLTSTVGERVRALYKSLDASGQACDVLYYFWVKQAPCPKCTHLVDLFSSRIFARNAYPNRKPKVQVCCPRCSSIFSATNAAVRTHCPSCKLTFNPQIGHANGADATCPACSHTFVIAESIRTTKRPPSHRLYAKLVLTSVGEKQYLPATTYDLDAYSKCSRTLRQEVRRGKIRLPNATLADGHNTRQAIGYNYRKWRDFFNDRQLLGLGWLHEAIAGLPDTSTRDAFLTLFSGLLEFNNLFASYKGEGTGAVRHMFSHHILKPERTPIEANVWGTPKSSGSFSNLFRSRLLRAVEYKSRPFEIAANGSVKTVSCSAPFTGSVETHWPTERRFNPRGIYLSCGSSDETTLPDKSVDLIVTDPPFFDNVHYSELADFFYAWQKLHPRGFLNGAASTRHIKEVQDKDATAFSIKLRSVFSKCYRTLKQAGLLVFTYHHSRAEGWLSLAEAVYGSGFSIINAHPVKAEMSVATPKAQAKDPIQLDIILVCRKRPDDARPTASTRDAFLKAKKLAGEKLGRLSALGLKLSRNDCRVALYSQFLAALGPVEKATDASFALIEQEAALDEAAWAEAVRHNSESKSVESPLIQEPMLFP